MSHRAGFLSAIAVTLVAVTAAPAHAFPERDAEVELIIDWCNSARVKGAAITPLPMIYTQESSTGARDSGIDVALKLIEGIAAKVTVSSADNQTSFPPTKTAVTVQPDTKHLTEVMKQLESWRGKPITAPEWNMLLLRAVLAADHESLPVTWYNFTRPSAVVGDALQDLYRTRIRGADLSTAEIASLMHSWLREAAEGKTGTDEQRAGRAEAKDHLADFSDSVLNLIPGACTVAALGGELSLYALNRAVAARAYPIGISFAPVPADGLLFGPLQFFVHDVTHSIGTERDFFRDPRTLVDRVDVAACAPLLTQTKDELGIQLVLFIALHENLVFKSWEHLATDILGPHFDKFRDADFYGGALAAPLSGDLSAPKVRSYLETALKQTFEALRKQQSSGAPCWKDAL